MLSARTRPTIIRYFRKRRPNIAAKTSAKGQWSPETSHPKKPRAIRESRKSMDPDLLGIIMGSEPIPETLFREQHPCIIRSDGRVFAVKYLLRGKFRSHSVTLSPICLTNRRKIRQSVPSTRRNRPAKNPMSSAFTRNIAAVFEGPQNSTPATPNRPRRPNRSRHPAHDRTAGKIEDRPTARSCHPNPPRMRRSC